MTAQRRAPVLPIAIALLILAIPLTAWMLRGAIATSIARSELSARGLECDERLSVAPSALFDAARIGPTRCTLEGGLVEAVELTGEAVVELDGLAPAALRAAGVRVELRDRDVRGGTGWAPALRRVRLEERVAGLVKGLSELGGMELPKTRVERVEVLRGGAELARIDQLVLTPAASKSMEVAIEQVAFAAAAGAASLTLDGVTGSATASAVQLEGQATARAGIALLGMFSTGGAFTLGASALDTDAPRFHLSADF